MVVESWKSGLEVFGRLIGKIHGVYPGLVGIVLGLFGIVGGLC